MENDLVSVLQEANEIVDKAKVAPDLRAAALQSTVQALLARGHAGSSVPDAGAAGSGDALGVIAARLRIDRSVAEQVFDPSDGDVQIVVPSSRLDRTKSKGAQQIALLVTAARQALSLDEAGWTSIEPIRAACEYFGRYDSGNFATSIRGAGDAYSVTVRGSGKRNRELRMTAPAWDHARSLVLTLTGSRDASE